MKHGNTYTQLVTVKGVDLTQASSVILTLQPRSREPIRLTGENMAISSDGTDTTIAYKLTEEQSLYLGAYYKIDVNFMLGGNRGGTSIETVRARPTLLLEPIGGGDVVIDPDATEPDIAELTTEEARVVNAVSPHITTVQTETGAVITINDIDGTHTVTLENGSDGRGIVGTVLNADYTLTITYSDGTSFTTPSIRGEKGDTGNGITLISKTATSGLVDTYTVTFTDGNTATFTVTNGAKGDKGDTGDSGVYVGTTQPTDPDVNVWLDPSGTQTVHGVPAGGTTGQVMTKASDADYDTEWTTVEAGGGTVTDVQVNGVSVLQDGVANVPVASNDGSIVGVVKAEGGNTGISVSTDGKLMAVTASNTEIKEAAATRKMVIPSKQHQSVFYGLAKAAGDTTQSQSSNAVGTYTDEAKAAIQSMLGINSAATLADLTDTNISNPSNGQFLRYNRSTGKWLNSSFAVTIPTEVQPYREYEDTSGYWVQGATILVTDPESQPLSSSQLQYYLTSVNNARCPFVYVETQYEDPTTQETITEVTAYPFTQLYYFGDASSDTVIAIFGTRVYKTELETGAGYLVLVSTDGRVPIDGATPAITAVNGLSYKCGTVTSLTITPPANGVCSVRFTSGATTTALTATGVTFPAGFLVRANTIYDIHISDGLATVDSWAVS